jgi:arylsulfatase A-like enzyme
MPLLTRFPDSVEIDQPTTVDMIVCTIDIFPTFLNLADAGLSEIMNNHLEAKTFFQ